MRACLSIHVCECVSFPYVSGVMKWLYGWKARAEETKRKRERGIAQGILLKHKFNIEWHLNNNNRPSIIFTTLLCRAYRFLFFRMNHAIDKLCWWIFAVFPFFLSLSHTIFYWFYRSRIPSQHSSLSNSVEMCEWNDQQPNILHYTNTL